MIDQFINFVIRPPRADYNPEHYLWEWDFTLAGRKYKRQDLELINERGHALKCSHYTPTALPENIAIPCVIYCHGNSGCRADANEAAVILLPSNISVFTLDFSGSGLSGGDYVSLGWHEKNDLKTVVSFLRNNKQISCIGLWGRSMGAVTSLLYGADDPSIAGMVLDSAFSNLYNLMMELVDVYKIRLPKFTVKMAVQYMRHVIQRRAKFDIKDLNIVQYASKTFIPALFGHASDDIFIQPHHSDFIFQSYAGDKNMIKFDGDHNSPRPQFYYDSVSIFFYNVLQPPQISSEFSNNLEKYYDLGDLPVGVNADESVLYEIITGLHATNNNSASSSSAAPGLPNGPHMKSVVELLSGSVSQMSISDDDVDFLLEKSNTIAELDGNDSHEPPFPVTQNEQDEESHTFSSSNRESFGRCSSLGVASVGSSSSEDIENHSSRRQMMLRALATPLRKIHRRSPKPKEKKNGASGSKKPTRRWSKFDKAEALFTRRLRLCLLGRSNHKRNHST